MNVRKVDVVHCPLLILCGYYFDRQPSQPQGFCATENARGGRPVSDDVPGVELLHQLAPKHENC